MITDALWSLLPNGIVGPCSGTLIYFIDFFFSPKKIVLSGGLSMLCGFATCFVLDVPKSFYTLFTRSKN
jgi:hypothetical protein